jgi:tetratricopeptide (TPR) repeat protein
MTVGDAEHGVAVAREHRVLAEEQKQPSQRWYSAVLHSHRASMRGEFAMAEQLAEEALEIGRRVQRWDAGFSYRIALVVLRREQSRLKEVDALVRQSVDEYRGYRSFRCFAVLVDHELGRDAEARLAFDELARDDFAALPRDSEWLFCLALLSETAAYMDDRDRAAVLYRLLLPYARLNAIAAGEAMIGSVARYLGILARMAERWDEAERHFELALEMNERLDARPWLAHTREDYGRMLLARDGVGDRERADELLQRALVTYRALGMDGFAARCAEPAAVS